MPKTASEWITFAGRATMVLIAGTLMVACNLGPQAPEASPTSTPPIVIRQDLPTLTPTLTPPSLLITPSPTPPPQLLPNEQLGPVTVDGVTHRTQEPVTVRVRYGSAVAKPNCVYILQDTSKTTPLTGGSTTQISSTTNEDDYTFTPDAAGTYVIACTSVALTSSGQRPVDSKSQPFAVEAKG